MKIHKIVMMVLIIVFVPMFISCSSGGSSKKSSSTALEFTSPENITVALGVTLVMDVETTSENEEGLTYRLLGDDASLFSINEDGQISFVGEALARTYQLTVEVELEGKIISQELTIVVEAVANHTPTITSSNSVLIEENQNRAFTVSATDEDGDEITYSIEATDDGASFSINPVTGLVLFIETPDFEVKSTYLLSVSASDNIAKVTQRVNVTIIDVTEGTAPIITNSEVVSVDENQKSAFTVSATDIDGDTITYSFEGGADDSKFDINSTTGEIVFKVEPDYETQNRYNVTVGAYDGLDTTTKNIQININDLVGGSRVIKTGQLVRYLEKDDGYYQSGLDRDFTRTPIVNSDGEQIYSYAWVTNVNTGILWRDSPAAFIYWRNYTDAEETCHNMDYDDGYSNFRLPTITELSNTADRSTNVNSLFRYYEVYGSTPEMTEEEINALSTWSSTTDADGNHYAFNFNTNSIEVVPEGTILMTRCVQPTLFSAYLLNRFSRVENIISDATTKLQWYDKVLYTNASGTEVGLGATKGNFEEAVERCGSLIADGKNDWRLANINELLSITNYRKIGGVGLYSEFATRTAGKYISSTTSANDASKVMYMNFGEGTQSEVSKLSNENYRCVRTSGD